MLRSTWKHSSWFAKLNWLLIAAFAVFFTPSIWSKIVWFVVVVFHLFLAYADGYRTGTTKNMKVNHILIEKDASAPQPIMVYQYNGQDWVDITPQALVPFEDPEDLPLDMGDIDAS